jgi:TrbL/VirB6 plasmid conjugal transfer protein
MFRLIFVIVTLVMLVAEPTSAGFLNDINNSFRAATQSWLGNALNVAELIFGLVMGVFIIFVLCKAALASLSSEVSIGTVLWPLGNMLFFMIGPLVVLKVGARELLPNIIGAAGQLSAMITGKAVSATQPDDIFVIGKTFADTFLRATAAPLIAQVQKNNGLGILDGHAMFIGRSEMYIGAIVYFIVLLAFGIIAFEVLATYVDVYIAIATGAINLGWLGAGGTAHMANAYIQSVWSTILRLIVIFSFVALLGGFIANWTLVTQAADPEIFLKVCGEIVATAVGALYATFRLGKMCDKISGTSATFNAVEAISSAINTLRKLK